MADLLSTDTLKADCGGEVAAVTSPIATIGGNAIVLAGTTVDGVTVGSLNTTMTVGGVAVLTTDDVYTAHTIPGPVEHSAGSLSSAATGGTV